MAKVETKAIEEALALLVRAGYETAARLAREEFEGFALRLMRAEDENPNTRSLIRAQFAAAALTGLCVGDSIDWRDSRTARAREAWAIADEVLEARSVRPEKPVDVAALVEALSRAVGRAEFRASDALVEDLIALVGDAKRSQAEPALARSTGSIADRVGTLALDVFARDGREFTTAQVAAAIGLKEGRFGAAETLQIDVALKRRGFEKIRATEIAGNGPRYVWRKA